MASALFVIAFAAVTLAAPQILSRRGFGGVTLMNNCQQTVYSFTTTPEGIIDQGNIAPGEWYWQPYQYPGEGNGVSIKLGMQAEPIGPITQLEYSFLGSVLYYDVSNVNCGETSQSDTGPCPFLDGGIFLKNDETSCPTVTCDSGDTNCHQVYNLPDDNWATQACEYGNNNMVMFMCATTGLG